jgi:hypothetical protein
VACGYIPGRSLVQELVLGGNWVPPLVRPFSFSLCYCFFLLCTLQVCFTFHVSRRVLACFPLVFVHHCTTPYYGVYHTALDLTSTATATASTSSSTSVPFALPIVRSVFSLRTYISPVCFFTTLPSSVSLAEFFSYCHHTTPPHTIQHSTAPSTSQPNQASIALTPALCACAHP